MVDAGPTDGGMVDGEAQPDAEVDPDSLDSDTITPEDARPDGSDVGVDDAIDRVDAAPSDGSSTDPEDIESGGADGASDAATSPKDSKTSNDAPTGEPDMPTGVEHPQGGCGGCRAGGTEPNTGWQVLLLLLVWRVARRRGARVR